MNMHTRPMILALFLALPPVTSLAADEGHHHDQHDMEQMHGGVGTTLGQPGNAHEITRTVTITVDDSLRYSPDSITVKPGETVRFFIKNEGGMTHEMVIGSMDELRAHAEMMRNMPDMKHTGPNMASIKPGKRSAIIWRFDKPGTAYFGCLISGHLEGGMVGRINIE